MISKPSFIAKVTVSAMLLLINMASVTPSQIRDSFEGTQPSWSVLQTGSAISKKTIVHDRHTNAHSGSYSERVRFDASGNSPLVLGLDVKEIAAIAELVPTLWVKSNVETQLVARVVLPHSFTADSREPITLLVEGEVASPKRGWQKLVFSDKKVTFDKLVSQKLWLLRERYPNAEISSRSAFVDRVMVRVLGRRGRNEVAIDDLLIQGAIGATKKNKLIVDPHLQKASANLAIDDQKPKALVTRQGSVLLYRGLPLAIRSIQHNGESFEFLKRIGFNTIELREPATAAQLQEAKRLSLWLISPPPEYSGVYKFDDSFDRVLAWRAGEKLSNHDLPDVQQTIRELQKSDYRSDRPILLDVVSDWGMYGRLGSIITVSPSTIASGFSLRDYDYWIARWRKSAGDIPFFVGIQTELPQGLANQVTSMIGRSTPVPIGPQQMQYAAYEALSSGARGIRFMSRSRLDSDDPAGRLRTASVAWLNQQLIQLTPWMAGAVVMDKFKTGVQNLEISELKTDQARLLLVQKTTGYEQWFAGDASVVVKSFIDTRSKTADQAYHLGEMGPMPKSSSTPNGLSIQLIDGECCSAYMVTQSAMLNRVARSYDATSRRARSQLKLQLVQNRSAIMQLISQQNTAVGAGNASVQAPLDQAMIALRQAQQLIANQSYITADAYLSQANFQLARSQREMVLQARRGFNAATGSPLVLHYSLIPEHWDLSRRLRQIRWQPNGLAGGDFENLGHLQKHGWKNQRNDNDAVTTHVELSRDAAVAGQFGLKMTVSSRQGLSNDHLVQNSPIWISSGPVPVKLGQLVRIHGWVRIDQTITGSANGFMITDSLGGKELSERFFKTNGWQEFTLYRAADRNGTIQVQFALCGLGSILLDEVTIRAVDLPPKGRQANQPFSGSR